MNKSSHNQDAPARESFTVEDRQGFIYLSYKDKDEAHVQAAMMAEECESDVYVARHTLH